MKKLFVLIICILALFTNPTDCFLITNASAAEAGQALNISEYDGMRVLLISDIHLGKAVNPHVDNPDGTTSGAESGGNADIYDEDRINILVNSANYEHSKKPIDFCLIVGDCVQLSGYLPSGRVLADEPETHRQERLALYNRFKQEVVDRLAMPCYVIPGNHDVATNEEWKSIFGHDKSFVVQNEKYSFVCTDMYSTADKIPFRDTYNSFGAGYVYIGIENGTTPDGNGSLLDWVEEKVDESESEGKKIFMVWHTFDNSVDTQDTEIYHKFTTDTNIVSQIAGHNHIKMYSTNIGKNYIGTGNFGYIFRNPVTESNPYSGSEYAHTFSNGVEYADMKTSYYSFKILEDNLSKLQWYTVFPEIMYRTFCGGYTQEYNCDKSNAIILEDYAAKLPYAELNVTVIQHTLNVELRLKNKYNLENQTYTLQAAYFSGAYGTGQLIDTVTLDSGILPEGASSKCFSETVPENCLSVKVFVWSSLGRLKPLCQSSMANIQADASEHLRAAILSDLHIGANRTTYCGLSSSKRMQLLVDSINAEAEKAPIDFVLVTGDVVADGGLDSFMQDWLNNYESQLSMPVYYARGNHDRYKNEAWEKYTGSSLQYSFESDKYNFVVMDAYPNINEYDNAKQYHEIDDADIEYIESTMGSGKTTFVVSHFFMDITESSKICSFASQNQNVAGLIYGHEHVFNNVKGRGFCGLQTGSFFEPTYIYPTLEQLNSGLNKNLLGWRMLEEKDDDELITYEVQPENYYPYWNLQYPYTIQQKMTIMPSTDQTDEITITASSYQNSEHMPQHSADEDISTWWASSENGAWIDYSFGKARDLSKVKISFYNASATRKARFEIYISSNGAEYTKVFSGQSTRSDSQLEDFEIGEQTNITNVKLVCNGNTENNWNAIREVIFE